MINELDQMILADMMAAMLWAGRQYKMEIEILEIKDSSMLFRVTIPKGESSLSIQRSLHLDHFIFLTRQETQDKFKVFFDGLLHELLMEIGYGAT